MKRYLSLIVLATMVAAASYALTYGLMAHGEEDQMAWLQREFKLTTAQTAAVEKLHAAYQPVCAEHCRMIISARERLAAAPSDPAMLVEITRLEQICRESTLAHLHEIAGCMGSAQGRRFLALVEPKVSSHAHQGPLGLK